MERPLTSRGECRNPTGGDPGFGHRGLLGLTLHTGAASTEAVFALLQSDPLAGAVSLDLLLLVGNLVGLPLFAVQYVWFKPINRSYALMAHLIGVIAIALVVPARPILEMVYLGRLYSGADPVAQGPDLVRGGCRANGLQRNELGRQHLPRWAVALDQLRADV